MPSFDTPRPISVTAHVEGGSVRFAAGDRLDTVVEVRPRDPQKDRDVRTAGQTTVTFEDGELTVRTPKAGMLGRIGTVDVTVELPAGSAVHATGSWTRVVGEGRLGEVRVKTSTGDVRLDTTGRLRLAAAHGEIDIDRVAGAAEISTSSGRLHVGTLEGDAVLKNSHGSTTIGTALGELRVRGANGDIVIGHAEGSVAATTAHGALRVDAVTSGQVRLETSFGSITVGVSEGTAAWLDVSSEMGQVHNALTGSEGPGKSEDTVEVRARTRFGNIEVRRARA
ncbi:DUF4097 family beta strand repeat-containing protein [Streptomyces sp. NPDC002454]